MNQVAQLIDQIRVMAANKLPPGEVCVPLFRPVGNEEITDAVRVIAIQKFLDPYGPIAAGGDFSAFKVLILAGDNPVRQLQIAFGQQEGGEDD